MRKALWDVERDVRVHVLVPAQEVASLHVQVHVRIAALAVGTHVLGHVKIVAQEPVNTQVVVNLFTGLKF